MSNEYVDRDLRLWKDLRGVLVTQISLAEAIRDMAESRGVMDAVVTEIGRIGPDYPDMRDFDL